MKTLQRQYIWCLNFLTFIVNLTPAMFYIFFSSDVPVYFQQDIVKLHFALSVHTLNVLSFVLLQIKYVWKQQVLLFTFCWPFYKMSNLFFGIAFVCRKLFVYLLYNPHRRDPVMKSVVCFWDDASLPLNSGHFYGSCIISKIQTP